jgi:hypothetical protein
MIFSREQDDCTNAFDRSEKESEARKDLARQERISSYTR